MITNYTSLSLSLAIHQRYHLWLRILPGRLVLKKALSPLLKVSMATGTAICRPDGISLQALPEELHDVFALVCATLRLDPISNDLYRCSRSITADFQLHLLDFILNFAPDEGNFFVTVKDYDDEIVSFAFGVFEGDILSTRHLPRVSNEYFMEIAIDDSDFEYAVLVGIASEDFRWIIRHFRDISPFVEAIVTDEEVTFRFGPEEIVLRTEDGDCVIGGINGYHRVIIRLSLLNADALLEASELCTSVWMFKSCEWPDLLSCPVPQLGSVRFYFKNVQLP